MTESASASGNLSILLATGNPAKQDALRGLIEGLHLLPVTPEQIGLNLDPEEEGDTHHAIARMKAREWSLAASMLVIASDGGLVIPALGQNWESRFTHRFAGLAADDAERVRRLLELMAPYRGQDREASWVEALAIADRGMVLASWQLPGATGLIAESAEEIGGSPAAGGFWVFSVWRFPQFGNQTYNQLAPEELAALNDHWAQLRDLTQDFFDDYLTIPFR